MAISYVVDTYRGDIVPTTLEKFAVYLSFFPHLVAGPIVRPGELIPQLDKPRNPRRVDTSRAFYLIATGLFKKVVIANYLASHIVDQVFGAPGQHSSLEILIGIYAYAVQIYADFSGYTDIAIGLALLLGFRFPQNFDSPYAAQSLQDFWRRWHMTLSRWLRDYLYIPLGGNRKGKIDHLSQPHADDADRRALARRRVDVHRLGRDPRGGALLRALAQGPAGLRRAPRHAAAAHVSRLVTFNIVCLAWVFFRADSFATAWDLLTGLFTGWGQGSPLVTGGVLLAIAVGIGSQYLPARFPTLRDGPVRTAARARPGRRARVRAHAHEYHGPRGHCTLHLLPLLMASENPPELPKLPPIRESAEHVAPSAAGDDPVESIGGRRRAGAEHRCRPGSSPPAGAARAGCRRSVRHAHPRRTRPSTRRPLAVHGRRATARDRRPWVDSGAPRARLRRVAARARDAQGGIQRSARHEARRVARAHRRLAHVSHAVLLDRPRRLVQDAMGREDADKINVAIIVPHRP